MIGHRPSAHRDAEVAQKIQKRRAGSTIHARCLTKKPPNAKLRTKCKLTEDQVRWARSNWKKLTLAAMARELGVTAATIGNICRGKSWKNVT